MVVSKRALTGHIVTKGVLAEKQHRLGRYAQTPDGGYGIRNVYEPVPKYGIHKHYGYVRKLGSKYGYVKYSELSQNSQSAGT